MATNPADQTPALGIDVGGSGIKGAPVDLTAGEMMTDRLRIPTPAKSTPKNVAAVVGEIFDNFKDTIRDGPIGVTVPAVVTHGKTRTAANIDKAWIDCEAEKIFEDELGRDILLVKDAETRAASSIKDKEGLSYTEWAKRLQRYYETLEALLWPDLIVVGGGVSKNADKFIPKLKLKTEMVPAKLRNSAGIVGAAWLAADRRVNPDPMM